MQFYSAAFSRLIVDERLTGRGKVMPVIGQGRLTGDPNLMLATDD